jgi:hypothetical protein
MLPSTDHSLRSEQTEAEVGPSTTVARRDIPLQLAYLPYLVQITKPQIRQYDFTPSRDLLLSTFGPTYALEYILYSLARF